MMTLRDMRRTLVYVASSLTLAAVPPDAAEASGPRQNAAAVYYQACLLRHSIDWPEESIPVGNSIEPESDPTPEIKALANLLHFKETMRLATAASRMSECDWEIAPSWILSTDGAVAAAVSGGLGSDLLIQAKVLAGDGRYRAALENALTMRRMSRHLGHDTYRVWYHSIGLEIRAFLTIQHVLGKMPADSDTLAWLERELAAVEEIPFQPREDLARWSDWQLQRAQVSPDSMAEVARALRWRAEITSDAAASEELSGTQVLEQVRLIFNSYVESALEILDSDGSFEDKIAALSPLRSEASGEAALLKMLESSTSTEEMPGRLPKVSSEREMAIQSMLADVPVYYYYRRHLYCQAYSNATAAAIAIYRIESMTGQLPQTLPRGLPGAPYHGEDFEYEVADEGFILRCRDIADDPLRDFSRLYRVSE